MLTYIWHIVWNKLTNYFVHFLAFILNMVNIDCYSPQKSVWAPRFLKEWQDAEPQNLENHCLRITDLIIFLPWGKQSFPLCSAVKHLPLAQTPHFLGSWVQIVSLIASLPALPQILTIDLFFFCLWHGSREVPVVHSPWQASELLIRWCPQAYEDCHFCLGCQPTKAKRGLWTQMHLYGWQWEGAASRFGRWRFWAWTAETGRETQACGEGQAGPYRSRAPSVCEKPYDWCQSHRQGHVLCRFQGPQKPYVYLSPANHSKILTSIIST